MNALANSQEGELEKFLSHGYPDGRGPVTFRRYTGQEKDEQREEISPAPAGHPAHQLRDARVHPHSPVRPGAGPGGARASRSSCSTSCTPTAAGRAPTSRCSCAASATPVKRTEPAVRRHVGDAGRPRHVRRAARRGRRRRDPAVRRDGRAGRVIGETLRPATERRRTSTIPASSTQLTQRVASRTPASRPTTETVADPLACWIERTLGIACERGRRAAIARCPPRPLHGDERRRRAARRRPPGFDASECLEALQGGAARRQPGRRSPERLPGVRLPPAPVLQPRRHGYASLDPRPSATSPRAASSSCPATASSVLLPLAFCRECGQEYYTRPPARDRRAASVAEPREISDRSAGEDETQRLLLLLARRTRGRARRRGAARAAAGRLARAATRLRIKPASSANAAAADHASTTGGAACRRPGLPATSSRRRSASA